METVLAFGIYLFLRDFAVLNLVSILLDEASRGIVMKSEMRILLSAHAFAIIILIGEV